MSSLKGQSVVVRPAVSEDIPIVTYMDHTSTTDYVWQMDLEDDETLTRVTFRRVRLPRSVDINPPRNTSKLSIDWRKRALVVVAERDHEPRGYLAVSHSTLSDVGLIADFAVDRNARRQGIGTVLLASAMDWARRSGLHRLFLETQNRNDGAICFCRASGFAYSGYNDRYYSNDDIAMFFGRTLR